MPVFAPAAGTQRGQTRGFRVGVELREDAGGLFGVVRGETAVSFLAFAGEFRALFGTTLCLTLPHDAEGEGAGVKGGADHPSEVAQRVLCGRHPGSAGGDLLIESGDQLGDSPRGDVDAAATQELVELADVVAAATAVIERGVDAAGEEVSVRSVELGEEDVPLEFSGLSNGRSLPAARSTSLSRLWPRSGLLLRACARLVIYF